MFLLRLLRAPDELLGRDLVVEGLQVLLRLRQRKTKKGQQGGTSLEKKVGAVADSVPLPIEHREP